MLSEHASVLVLEPAYCMGCSVARGDKRTEGKETGEESEISSQAFRKCLAV